LHEFHVERFNLKMLNRVESKQQYHAKVWKRFAALEDQDVELHINSAWEAIRENIEISAKEILWH
jgi:hypothetical protein